ncbi:MAG TPA: hypothetical protein VK599_06665 [Streptosporangiaceae bacterium]|nr:hypothetical protein [Streptosporangiaceae bacterium]
MSGRRLDVTPTQAVSSMMAALTGAIAASSLGIAGTLIGAAFMSLASTVGAAVYKHYLARSNERLRAAAAKASNNAVAGAVLRHHLHLDPDDTAHLRPDGQAVVETSEDADAPAAERTATAEPAGAAGGRAFGLARPDSAEVRVRPALAGAIRPGRHARPGDPAGAGAAAAFGRDDSVAAAVAAGIAAAVLGDHTALGHANLGYTAAEHPAAGADGDVSTTADLRPATDLAETADLGPDLGPAPGLRDGAGPRPADRLRDAAGPGNAFDADPSAQLRPAGRGTGSRSGRPRWLKLSAAVLGAFVVAMGAVTAVEAIAGKPLETLIWHRSGSGTTLGSVVSPPRHHPASVPTNAPAQSRSPSAQPSSTSPGVASPTPTPTPSQSVAPSQSASTSPGTGTSPGAGTGTGTAPGTGTSPDSGTSSGTAPAAAQ